MIKIVPTPAPEPEPEPEPTPAPEPTYSAAAEALRPIIARAVAENRWRLAGDLANALYGLTATASATERPGRPERHEQAARDLFGPGLNERTRAVPLIRPPALNEQPRADVTVQFERPPVESGSRAPGVCGQLVESLGSRRMCGAPIVWQQGAVGDATRPPVQAGWRHLDTSITDHPAATL